MFEWTLLFHIVGLVFWIGGLLVATSLLGQHSDERSPEGRTALGLAEVRMLSGMANPGAVITIVTGVILIELRGASILHTTWLQGKLILVACLLILHGIAYIRARRLAAGTHRFPRRSWMILHGAISLVFFGILICVLPGRLYWK
jgi:protoporphyrinogen IX oxidase